jgi:hypothetical protein
MNPWVLTARVDKPKRVGFRRVRSSADWAKVSAAASGLVLDFRSITAPIVVYADDPARVDYDGVLNMEPGSYEPGRVHWIIPVHTVAGDSRTAQVFEQAHDQGELWLITGDVRTYWMPDQRDATPFERLFPDGHAWAAKVRLSTHLFTDGVGTRAK